MRYVVIEELMEEILGVYELIITKLICIVQSP